MSQYNGVSGPTDTRFVSPFPITAGADARGGALRQVQVTLPVAGTVYSVTLPTAARGFPLLPSTADVSFAVGEDPAALATISGNAVSANFSVGATAPLGEQTVRILDDFIASAGASLRLRSATANANVVVATF